MIYYPPKCLRGLSDCRPLAAIQSDSDDPTFICMGENDHCSRVPTDIFRVCQRSAEGVDAITNHDRRDIADIMSVLAQGVAMIELEAVTPHIPTNWPRDARSSGGGG